VQDNPATGLQGFLHHCIIGTHRLRFPGDFHGGNNSPVRFFSKKPKFPINFASGGQKPFREKVSGLPKAFNWDVLDALFFSRPSRTKI
jgi:hypothetical protein